MYIYNYINKITIDDFLIIKFKIVHVFMIVHVIVFATQQVYFLVVEQSKLDSKINPHCGRKDYNNLFIHTVIMATI